MNSSQESTKKPPYFYFYTKYFDFINLLSDEEVGQVIKYIGEYIQQYGTDNTAAAQAKSENVKVVMLCTMFEQDINNAFKKYFAQCKNGAKGGAPKGNKNAAKKVKNSIDNVEVSNDNGKIVTIILILFEEENDILQLLELSQVAEVATCLFLLDVTELSELKDNSGGYKTAYEYIDNKGADKAIKELKECAKQFAFPDNNAKFKKAYSEIYKRVEFFLTFDKAELDRFYSKCYSDSTINDS